MKLVFDIETNGLYHEATTAWCISLKDVENPNSPVESFYNMTLGLPPALKESRSGTLTEALRALDKADVLIGHNIINYDLPILEKLYGWKPRADVRIYDTLVVSRLLHPDRPKPSHYSGKGGPHSLECWGYRTKKAKPSHEDWSCFSKEMLHRNKEDVEINYLTYLQLEAERTGWDWDKAIDLEHSIAKIITDQEIKGVLFARKRATECVRFLEECITTIDREVVPNLPHSVKQRGATVLQPFTRTGAYTKRYREDISYCSGPFSRIDIIPFDIGSIQQVKAYLLENGWEPEYYNYSRSTGEKSSPKLEGTFKGVDGDLPQQVKKRISILKRKSVIEGWISNVRADGRITACANPCGTNTGRMRHSVVANVPKANSDKEGNLIWCLESQKDYFGTQMRSLFTVPRHYKMVGHDAKGLELRVLAHYMNDPEFTKEVLSGDIHEFNRKAAGLPTRDAAKTFIYAFIYGAGDAKLGNIIGGSKADGTRIRRKFLKALPNLDKLIKTTKRQATRGYLLGLDGRRVWMRYGDDGRVMTHKALNTLLQCGGSLVMKKSSDILWNELVPKNMKAYKIIDMHDEGQSQVVGSAVELYSKLAVKSIQLAGEHYNLSIPMDADVKVGTNWAETH